MGNLLGAPVTEKETHTGATPEGIHFGVSSMQGWRVHMEDAHIAETRLYAAEAVNGNPSTTYRKIDLPGHALFAVFDGHGGTYAATYSGQNLCRVLARTERFVEYGKFVRERKTKEKSLSASERAEYIRSGLNLLELALCDAFVELDCEIACALKGTKVADADLPYHDDDHIMNLPEDAGDMEGVTRSDSQASPTDSALQLLEDEGDSGTTACVVLLTPDWVICANAGDSRSVISKIAKAVPLSYDHKPDDEGEERRIRAGGGYVAVGRVEGDLAVSRGLGDFRFKNLDVVMAAEKTSENGQTEEDLSRQRRPVTKPGEQKVSPIPDILVHNRNAGTDEFIIIACDGIWDVQTNYEAVKLVSELFLDGEDNLGLICEEVCDVCLGMGSKDNMTTLVVKLEAQVVGKGGGVLARRQLRENEQNEGQGTEDQS